MQFDAAVQGGTIAADITEIGRLIDGMKALLQDGAYFSGNATVSDPVNGNVNLSFPSLTSSESAAVFHAVIAAFQARLDAKTAQLESL